MDEIDRNLLRLYQDHPDYSMSDVGERIGLSRAACWKRLNNLQERGFISGRAVLLNQKALGLNITVIADVKLTQTITETLEEFEAAVLHHPEIVACYTMSGDSDYVLRIVARDIEAYEVFLREKLAKMPHVSGIKSSFALKAVKNTTKLPI